MFSDIIGSSEVPNFRRSSELPNFLSERKKAISHYCEASKMMFKRDDDADITVNRNSVTLLCVEDALCRRDKKESSCTTCMRQGTRRCSLTTSQKGVLHYLYATRNNIDAR